MDFFGAQNRARQQSRLLTLAFLAAVTAVVFVLDVVALGVLRIWRGVGEQREPLQNSLTDWALLHPGTVLLVSLAVGGFIGVASMVRMLQLREGGGYVARSVGGVRVERDTLDPRRRQLHNVVEEMAIAAGIPVPEVYVLEHEDGINAFAAGHTPANAAVAVTRGALLQLNREQLQGVIAHEFSHILNGDMRLSMRLVGLVFGLMAVALAGRLLLRLSMGERRQAWPLLALGAAIAVIGQAGYWAGRLLQAWISRTRECLADASAVQFTRNPEGLRDALVRAAAWSPHRRFASAAMEEVAHMLFVPDTRRLLATHPSLLDRVQALDPHVNQAHLDAMVRRAREQMTRNPVEPAPTGPTAGVVPGGVAVPAAAALIAATAGDPDRHHLDQAIALRRALPPALRASAASPEQAQALLLAIVMSGPGSDAARPAQLVLVKEKLGPELADATQQAATLSATLPAMLRLPAVLQLMPALRALGDVERLHFTGVLREVLRADGQLGVFDYALEKLASRALAPRSAVREPHGNLSLDACAAALGVVFAVLARQGSVNGERARQAYEAGIAPLLPRHRPGYAVIEDWVPLFDEALDRLCRLRVAAKQLLVEGLVRTIAHDAVLAPTEAELLRTICAVLECPLPPVLPAATEDR